MGLGLFLRHIGDTALVQRLAAGLAGDGLTHLLLGLLTGIAVKIGFACHTVDGLLNGLQQRQVSYLCSNLISVLWVQMISRQVLPKQGGSLLEANRGIVQGGILGGGELHLRVDRPHRDVGRSHIICAEPVGIDLRIDLGGAALDHKIGDVVRFDFQILDDLLHLCGAALNGAVLDACVGLIPRVDDRQGRGCGDVKWVFHSAAARIVLPIFRKRFVVCFIGTEMIFL